jgi:hypothetical protein
VERPEASETIEGKRKGMVKIPKYFKKKYF